MATTHVLVWDLIKLLIAVLGVIYGGLVLTGYVTEGPHYRPRFDLSEPARSGERLLVWTGIKILGALLRIFRSISDQLFAASAEVGLWIVSKSGPSVQHSIRSRFL